MCETLKRSPERVLNSLMKQSKVSGYKFERLYRILFNEEMFYVAYQRIYAKQGNMAKGTDGKTADQMSILRIEHLIEKLRDESCQPHPSRRIYIPKKNGKKRPLGIPSFEDKLVQQVIKMILEAIYEGSFEPSSHGFRPRKSCHTALKGIQRTFTGTKWFIEGDIKGFFDNINHEVLINTLRERIADDRFIRLIRKFLNVGYVENWTYYKTYSGTPQGGIISPILANIYLDKFDKYMMEYIQKFDMGGRRRKHPQTSRLNDKKYSLALKLKTLDDEIAKAKIADEIRSIGKQQLQYIVDIAKNRDFIFGNDSNNLLYSFMMLLADIDCFTRLCGYFYFFEEPSNIVPYSIYRCCFHFNIPLRKISYTISLSPLRTPQNGVSVRGQYIRIERAYLFL